MVLLIVDGVQIDEKLNWEIVPHASYVTDLQTLWTKQNMHRKNKSIFQKMAMPGKKNEEHPGWV